MKKILIILYRTLGDCILGNTLIAEVKKKYPDSEITMAVFPEYVEIYDTNPNVKSLIITADYDITLREASSGKYDIVMAPAQLTHTSTIWHQVEKYKHGHLLDFYAKRCDVKVTDRREYMYPTEKDYEAVKGYIQEGVNIVVHTTSLVPSKNWPGFQEIVKELRGWHSLKNISEPRAITQIGGPNDNLVEGVTDKRGKLTYNQIAALLDKADLFVGLDSGLAYIASAMNCPNIVIMGMSTGSTSGPVGKHTHFIEPKRPCEWPCHTNCKKDNPCIKTITVDTVLAKIKEVLENGKEKKGVVTENKPEGNNEGGGESNNAGTDSG